FPEVAIGGARGDHLADHQGVAGAVTDAGELHRLEREVIEHAPEPAASYDKVGGTEPGPPEAVPANADLAWRYIVTRVGLPGQAAVERSSAVVVTEAARVVRDQHDGPGLARRRIGRSGAPLTVSTSVRAQSTPVGPVRRAEPGAHHRCPDRIKRNRASI